MNDKTFIEVAGEFVTVLGLLHVQTTALADGSVGVQANLTDQVLAPVRLDLLFSSRDALVAGLADRGNE